MPRPPKWYAKLGGDSSSSWPLVIETNHQAYVTLANPVTSLRQETLFWLSCNAAKEESQEGSARDAMYLEFEDQSVSRLDGTQMTYWVTGSNETICRNTNSLLSSADGDGSCEAWSGFFRDILHVHGIEADRIKVEPTLNLDKAVCVHYWSFDWPSGPILHPYIEFRDATDLNGIAGQGNPNPPGQFNGHWITRSGGHYYDPSYGTAAIKGGNIKKKYEDAAFDGYGMNYSGVGFGVRVNDRSSTGSSEAKYTTDN